MLSDLADLVLSRVCISCARPGPVLCAPCWGEAASCSVHPLVGDLDVRVGAVYADTAQRAVIALKDRGVLAMAEPIGGWLALAVAGTSPAPATLVPVPAHETSIAGRGVDTLDLIVRGARDALHQSGHPVRIRRLLRRRIDRGRHVGRSAAERAALVADTMTLHSLPPPGERLIVVDDVVTTGATVREAVRALVAGGCRVQGIAAACGTPRSGQTREPGPHPAHHGVDP